MRLNPTEALTPTVAMFDYSRALDNGLNLLLVIAFLVFVLWAVTAYDDWTARRRSRRMTLARNRELSQWINNQTRGRQ